MNSIRARHGFACSVGLGNWANDTFGFSIWLGSTMRVEGCILDFRVLKLRNITIPIGSVVAPFGDYLLGF